MPLSRHLLAALIALGALCARGTPTEAATLPAGFSDTAIARPDGQPWNDAVGLTYAADGRLYVWERAGRVWVVDPVLAHRLPLLDLAGEVGAYGELGLTGVALDPAFVNNGRLYLFYTVDAQHLANCDSPRVGPPACRSQPQGKAQGPFAATISRIVRYTLARPAGGDWRQATGVDPASRLVLLGESAVGAANNTGCVVTATVHGAGSLAFGSDGTLLASCGDGAGDVIDDTGNAPGTDFASALVGGLISGADNVGAFRAQRVDSLSGKILRLDPATGDGLNSNPFYESGAPRAARSRVWVLGLRNPERFAVRPATGSARAVLGQPGTLYIGDAGRYAWESLDVARGASFNFGWPLFEGMNADSVSAFNAATVYDTDAHNPLYPGACRQPSLEFRDLLKQDTLGAARWPNPCRPATALPASLDLFLHARPAIDWLHGRLARWSAFDADGAAVALALGQQAANGATVSGPLFGGSHSVGGTWYQGTDFPAALRNVYFHADAGAGWIKAFRFDANDNPVAAADFIDGAGAVRALASGPNGGLTFVSSTATSSVHHISYQSSPSAGSGAGTQGPTPPSASALVASALPAQATVTASAAVTGISANSLLRVVTKAGSSASVTTALLTGSDIGAVTTAGSYGYATPTYTLSGAGADVWGTSDAFQFDQTALSGDGSITARVVTDSAPNPWTKAGVMIRETLDPAARNAFVAITGSNGAVFQFRAAPAATSTSVSGPSGVGAPYWVRLARNGNLFTASASADGLTWTPINQVTLPLASSTYVGLAMTSHGTTAATATFDSLNLVTAPGAPAALSATPSGSAALVSWSAPAAGSNGIGGYYVYRNSGSTPIATVTTGTTYTDTSVSPSASYTYQVAAFDKTTPTPFISALSASAAYAPAGSPGTPGGLAVGAVSATSVTLSWSAASAGANGLGGYYVYRNGSALALASVTAGTSYTDTTAAPGTTYTYQVAAYDTTTPTPLRSALSASVSATTTAATSGTQNWTGTDIGSPTPAGSFAIGGNAITVNGAGADIWLSADSFQFVSQPFTGDGTITARVVSQTNSNGWAKAGLMIRESMAAGATHAMLALTPANGAVLQYRSATGGASTSVGANALAAPYWVRLNRSGSTYTGFVSADGISWTQLGQATLTMASSAYAGLAVTSHYQSVLGTAVFDSITFSGGGILAPSAPTGLAAPAVTSSAVTLSWTAAVAGSNPVAGYYVYRNGSATPIAITAGTTYTDVSVAANSTYTYTVAAFDRSTPQALVSPPSAPLSLTTGSVTSTPTAPAAPASLTASAGSASSVTLTWSASAAGSNGIGGYYLYRNGATTPLATITTGTTYTDSGLAAATTYSYQVAAFDKTTPVPLVSPAAGPASATTLAAAAPPGAPGGLTASAAGQSAVTLNWTAATAGSNGIGGYYLYRNGATTPLATVTTGTTYTDSGLAAATTYSYRVAAFDKTTPTPLVSPAAGPVSATTAAASAPPLAPTGLGTAAVGSSTVTLTWTAATAGSNGIGGYYVYRNGAATPVATVTSGTTYTDTGLAPATSYTYQLVTFDKTTPTPLTSPLSAVLSVTTAVAQVQPAWSGGDIGTPAAAGSFAVGATTITVSGSGADIWGSADALQFVSQTLSGNFTLTARVVSETNTNSWTKAGVMIRETLAAGATEVTVAMTPGNGAIIQTRQATNATSVSTHGPLVTAPYWIRLNRTGNVFTGFISADGSSFTQIGQYTVAMAATAYAGLAVTSHQDGSLATAVFDSITITGSAPVAPSTPTGLAATSVTAASVALSWNPAVAGTNPIAGYSVYRNGGTAPIATVTGTGYTDNTVAPATAYSYTVAAFDTGSPTPLASAASALLAVTTGAAAAAPAAPAGLTTLALTSSSIALSWTAATPGSNGIGGYSIYRNGASSAIATVTAGTSYTDTGLAAATTYSYQVAAFDRTTPLPLVSPLSPASTATTASATSGGATPPAAPTGLQVTTAASTLVSIRWNAASAGSNPVAGYLVYRNGATTPLAITTATSYTDSGLATATAYTYAVAAYDATTPTALLSPLSTTLSATTTGIVFTDADVGVTGATGSASGSAPTYVVNGAGADIWGTADGFNFDYQPFAGDGTITARVVSQTVTDPWAKAGVMIRESLAAGSTHVLTAVTPGNGAVLQYRPASDGISVNVGGNALAVPYWVRVTRSGNNFESFVSPNGMTWTAVGQATVPMARSVYLGLAVTSHLAGAISTATFDSVTIAAAATTPTGFGLSPRNAGITTAQTQAYTTTFGGQATAAVSFMVDGISGGNAAVGTISPAGVYVPPATAGRHSVTATSTLLPSLAATAQIGVTTLGGIYTYHEDAARTGQNLQEYALTSANVTAGTFGKLFSCPLDGNVYAQPVYVANVAIGGGVHNVVFVVTMHDSVYAFDADNPGCVNYWTTSYVKSDGSVTSVPNTDVFDTTGTCDDIKVEYGITGTPVVDPVGKVIYFVAKTKESGSWYQRLHALDLATGQEKAGSPVTISASVQSSLGTAVAFDPLLQNQRAGLALVNGQVYIGWGAHCDMKSWHGWLIAYNATTLVQTAAFNSTPNGVSGGIWMSGGAPAADSTGNVYVTTGNGSFDYTTAVVPPLAPPTDYGESYLKLRLTPTGASGVLGVTDFYTPSQNVAWSNNDRDLSSSGVVVLPDGAGPAAHPNVVVGSDKQAHLWMLDRGTPVAPAQTAMGGFSPVADNVVQYLSMPTGQANCSGLTTQGTPAFWNNTIYSGVAGGPIMAFALNGGTIPASGGVATVAAASMETYNFPVPTAVISSSPGSTSALLWALNTNANGVNNCNAPTAGPAILRAYDATRLGTAIYSSDGQPADAAPDTAIKYQQPVVANGHVYVAGTGALTVYGLLP